MAGPKRIPWRNMRELKRQYQYNFFVQWMLGTAMAWPAAVLIGRQYQKTWHGVPLVPIQWYKHDFIDVSPGVYARKLFRKYSVGSALALGWMYAFYVTDGTGWRSDKLKNRPDMKPYPAMVKQDPDDIAHETMERSLYKKASANDYKSSTWYRFIFPNDANFDIKRNPYRDYSHRELFNVDAPGYSTYTSTHLDHQH